MKTASRILLTVGMLFWAGWVLAQSLVVIELKSRTVDEVLPVLLPLVEPGGSLTGVNNQLFLRSSARNREDIQRALAAIDKPARRLIIRIAVDRQGEQGQRGGEANAQLQLGTRPRAQAEARVWDSRSARAETAEQQVQTIDGGRAFIQVGRSVPVPMRQVVVGPGGAVISEQVVYRDIGSGFHVQPRLHGERVTLEIVQQSERPDPRHVQGVETQRLATTLSGRLGEWMALGGSARQADTRQGGGLSLGTADLKEQRSLWLQVEALD